MGEGQLRFSLSERAAGSMSCPSQGSAITIVDEANARQILKEVHACKDINWALLGYDGASTDTLVLLGHGSGGVQEMSPHLTDNMIGYGLLWVVDVVDNIPTNRFAYINWVGEHVPAVSKARIATNKSSVLEVLGHYNVEVLASDKDDLKEDKVIGKIQDASGSRIRVKEEPRKVGGGGGGGVAAPRRQDVVPTANTSMVFQDDAGIRDVLADIRRDSSATNWLLLGYTDNKTLSKVGSGTGGLNELVQHLKPNAVNYGFLRTQDKVDNSMTTKFVFINWVGESVSPMAKGRISTHKGAINEYFEPFHLSIFAEKPDELDTAVLEAKLQSLKGFKN